MLQCFASIFRNSLISLACPFPAWNQTGRFGCCSPHFASKVQQVCHIEVTRLADPLRQLQCCCLHPLSEIHLKTNKTKKKKKKKTTGWRQVLQRKLPHIYIYILNLNAHLIFDHLCTYRDLELVTSVPSILQYATAEQPGQQRWHLAGGWWEHGSRNVPTWAARICQAQNLDLDGLSIPLHCAIIVFVDLFGHEHVMCASWIPWSLHSYYLYASDRCPVPVCLHHTCPQGWFQCSFSRTDGCWHSVCTNHGIVPEVMNDIEW